MPDLSLIPSLRKYELDLSAVKFVAAFGWTSTDAETVALGTDGIQEGDFVVILQSDDNTGDGNNPVTGTNSVWNQFNSSTGESIGSWQGWSLVTANGIDFNTENNYRVDVVTMTVWRNVDTTLLPTEAEDFGYGENNDPPAVNVPRDGSVVIIHSLLDDDNATMTVIPSGYTLAVQNGRTGGSHAQLYKLNVPAGTEVPGNVDWSEDDSDKEYAFWLAPPPSAGVKTPTAVGFDGGATTEYFTQAEGYETFVPQFELVGTGIDVHTENASQRTVTMNVPIEPGDIIVHVAGRIASQGENATNQPTHRIVTGNNLDPVTWVSADGYESEATSIAWAEVTQAAASFDVWVNYDTYSQSIVQKVYVLRPPAGFSGRILDSESRYPPQSNAVFGLAVEPNSFVVAMGSVRTYPFTAQEGFTTDNDITLHDNNYYRIGSDRPSVFSEARYMRLYAASGEVAFCAATFIIDTPPLITLVSSVVVDHFDSGSTQVFSTPTGMQQGDMLVITGGHQFNGSDAWGTKSSVSGWVRFYFGVAGGSWAAGYYQFVGATPPTTVDLGQFANDGTASGSVTMMVFRGVNQSNPLDTFVRSKSRLGRILGPTEGITIETPGAVVIAVHSSLGGKLAGGPPSGFEFVGEGIRNDNNYSQGAAFKQVPIARYISLADWKEAVSAATSSETQHRSIALRPAST